MRITTNQIYDNNLSGILDAQKKLIRSQDELVSGSKILNPSDDPAAATKVIRMEEELSRLGQFEENSILLQNELENQDTTLSNIHLTLGRARTLTLQAGDGILDDQDRQAIAAELTQIKDELANSFNSQNGQGEYIFAGSKTGAPPFLEQSNGNYIYQGDETVKKIQISETLKIDAGVPGSGFEIFENVDARSTLTISPASTATGGYSVTVSDKFEDFHNNNYVHIPPNPAGSNDFSIILGAGDTYQVQDNLGTVLDTGTLNSDNKLQFQGAEFDVNGTPGDQLDFTLDPPNKNNVLDTLNSLITRIESTQGVADDAYIEELQDAMFSIDNSLDSISGARAQIGGRVNVVESTFLTNTDLEINLKDAKAKISEVDYAEAISNLSQHETALQAANQTFGKVTGLSLFNFI